MFTTIDARRLSRDTGADYKTCKRLILWARKQPRSHLSPYAKAMEVLLPTKTCYIGRGVTEYSIF